MSAGNKPKLSRDEVNDLTAPKVHETIGRVMLADGFHFVVDFNNSKGSWLVNGINGQKYLDLFSYFASWAIGHNHPKMEDAEFQKKLLRAALNNPSNSDVYSIEMAQFVATFERVCMPPEFKHVFFISGGALAVENALKCAFDWKVRLCKSMGIEGPKVGSKVIHFTGAFHGRTGYTMSLTNTDPIKVAMFPKFEDWPRIETPSCTFPLTPERLEQVKAAEQKALSQIRELCEGPQGVDIAAIILETIQGEGGDRHFRKEFLQGLRDIADKTNVFLIFDEVQCGMGVTGKLWAWQNYGVVPDAFTFGKKAQVCGFCATSRVDLVPQNVFVVPSRINSTWGGSLTDMVRSQRIIEIIEEDHLVENASKVGKHLLEQLVKLQGKHPNLISNARGVGLFCAIDLPSTELRNKLRELAYERNLFLLSCGTRSIRFRPYLNITPEEVDLAIKGIDACLTQMKQRVLPNHHHEP